MEILEGHLSVLPALLAHQRKIHLIMIKSSIHSERIQDLLVAAERNGVSVKFCTLAEIDQLAHGKTHGGIIALCSPKPAMTTDQLLTRLTTIGAPPFLLLLEGVEDSQNLGFTLRSAEALGVHGVLLKKHLWDFDMNAVGRASSGAYERLPLVKLERVEHDLNQLKRRGVSLLGCIANARRTLYEVDLTGPVMLCVGGEKRGLSGALREHCNTLIRIPMAAEATSLSMGHAASVLMAEVMRQRKQD